MLDKDNRIYLWFIRLRQTYQFFRGGIPQVILHMYNKVITSKISKVEKYYLTRLFVMMNLGEILHIILTKIYKMDEDKAKEITTEIVALLLDKIDQEEHKNMRGRNIPTWYS